MLKSGIQDVKKNNILIIDDEILISRAMGEMLQFINSTVFYAEKANKAFEILENENIDLIILDALLPDIDGFNVASKIRKMQKGKNVPIIMMSGIYKKMKYKYQAKQAGINAFIQKPIRMETLLTEVKKLLTEPEQITL